MDKPISFEISLGNAGNSLIRGCSRLSLSVQRVSRVTQRYFKTDGFVHYLLVNHGRIHDGAKEEKVFMFVVDSLVDGLRGLHLHLARRRVDALGDLRLNRDQ